MRDLVDAIRLPATDPDASLNVREVRRYVREVLAPDAEGINLGDIDVVTSEIATNALLHTRSGKPGGGLRVAVFSNAERVRLEFEDDGGAETVPSIPDSVAESGRGLMIVRELADAWGIWQQESPQREVTVWVEVLRRPRNV
jgi:anti-sigma regulatory factor (Ser/Thr protein kinase)